MPSAKRERQRENRQLGRIEQVAAHKAAKRKKSSRNMAITVGIVAVLFVSLAFLVSRGGDDDTATTTTVVSAAPTTVAAATSVTARVTGDAAVDAITCSDTVPPANDNRPSFTAAPEQTIDSTHTYEATFVTSCGEFTAGLDVDDAPITVNNFVFLARAGFFDGTTFHRAVPNFVIQGGDPTASGGGDAGYKFADENIDEPYVAGSLAMANSGPNTNGSQFFVCSGTQPNCGLTQTYNNFGVVVQGLEVARKIESWSIGDAAPQKPMYLISVTITETDESGAVVAEPTTAESSETTAPVATTTAAAATTTTAG